MNHMRPIFKSEFIFLLLPSPFLLPFLYVLALLCIQTYHAIGWEPLGEGTILCFVEIVIIDAILFRYILMPLCAEL